MACPHCGSWSVKADRSLAGRLVCGRCGRPLGSNASSRRPPVARLRPRLPWWGWLVALLAVSAALASLQSPPQGEAPTLPSRPGASHGRSFL